MRGTKARRDGCTALDDVLDVRVEAAELVGMIAQWRKRMDDLGHGEVMLPNDVSCCMCATMEKVIAPDCSVVQNGSARSCVQDFGCFKQQFSTALMDL